ncbi:hypothetical protein FQZ97_914260 [compost metagenome]
MLTSSCIIKPWSLGKCWLLIGLSAGPALPVGLASAPAQFLWRPPNDSDEAAQHMIGIAEADTPGDLLERLMPVLDQRPRGLDAKALDGFRRRHPDGCREHAAKLADAHMRDVRQALNGQIVTQMIARITQHRADAI